MEERQEVMKYCVIVIATVPMMCIYPFVQRYFVKGVMIGCGQRLSCVLSLAQRV